MKEAAIIDACRSPIGRTGGRFALATLCVGGGQGMATIFESEDYQKYNILPVTGHLCRSAIGEYISQQ